MKTSMITNHLELLGFICNLLGVMHHHASFFQPPKFKEPSCPTISCVIGNSKIEKALLDLGASVNLLPSSVYEQLGLGELKPTSIILQLANGSMIVPRGVVEDVFKCSNSV